MAKKNDILKVEQPIDVVNTNIESLIRIVRNQEVILDSDLARLYGVETRALNQAVKRNIERFPADFMFQLTKEEARYCSHLQVALLQTDNNSAPNINLKSQIVTSSDESESAISNSTWGGVRKMPYAFTENGIAMLSSVLRSKKAIETNILIMRAFTSMRHFIGSHAQMFQRMEILEHTQLRLLEHQDITDHKLEQVFNRLDERNEQHQKEIFFDGQFFDAYTLIAELIKQATKRIILFDNYIDESVLNLLDKRSVGVTATIYTNHIGSHLQTDIARHDAQYPHIDIEIFSKSHDRFLCIDDTVYFVGASLKDLGKRWFAFGKMQQTTNDLLSKM